MKFFQKLLVAPATAAMLVAPTLNGFADETASDDISSDTLKISVTGTRSPRATKDVPASVKVTDKNEIDIRGITDLRDLFKYDAGVSIKSNSTGYFNNYGQNSINIRGMDENRVLIQRDNINLPNRYSFSYQLGRGDYVDLSTLKSVEVLKGPASSLYGSDALGGLISYQSLYPEDLLGAEETFKIELPVKYDGSSNQTSGTTRIAVRDDESGIEGVLVTTISYGEEDNVKADDKYIDDSEISKKNIYTNIVKNIDDFSRLNFIYENVDTKRDTTQAKARLISSYSSIEEDVDIYRWMGQIGYEYENQNSGKLINYAKINLYLQDTEWNDDSKVEYPAGYGRFGYSAAKTVVNDYRYDDESKGFNIQFKSDSSSTGVNHKFTYGIDYSTTYNSRPRKKITTQSGTTTVENIKDTADADTLKYGFYLQDAITFDKADKFELIAGIRYDKYDIDAKSDAAYESTVDGVGAVNPVVDIDNTTVNPSLALIYNLSPELSAFGKYSTAFRSPTHSELNTAHGNRYYGYYYLSNPDLKAETSKNYEFGLKGDYSKLDFSLVSFISKYDDLIEDSTTSTGTDCIALIGRPCSVIKPSNVEEAEIWGIELNSEYNFNEDKTGFSLISSLAYSHGDDTSGSEDKELTSIEPFKAILGLRYTDINNKWSTELTNTYVGDARTTAALDDNPSKSYSVLDLTSVFNVNERLSVDLGIFNLNDTRYFNYSTVKSQSSSSADVNRFSEPGRNVKAGFKFIF
ncbi:TonB-dependent receptor domain-containing protein [Prochlorococcus marinus]|uniref:TonB-dependent receptor domain-containing protein n=1 Tax=Prochlorococcus marinus TaxID=1219 RepID=UPI0022B35A2A|nr:TonB-dependent receptor [Prochlorococcus marinus]